MAAGAQAAAQAFQTAVASSAASSLMPGNPGAAATQLMDYNAMVALLPAGGAAPPAWAAPLMAQVAAMAVQLNNVERQSNLALARGTNASATNHGDLLTECVNAANVTPSLAVPAVHFPATVGALHALSNAHCDALLNHYGLHNPNPGVVHGPALMAKRRLVARYLGVPGF